jgi:putative N6-adenine-specific DNA methylase
MAPHRFDAFVITAPGLAPLCAAEMRAAGLVPTRVEAAGVAFEADAARLVRANLWLRTATRVIVRLASFKATTFRDLARLAATVPWSETLVPGQPVALRVTCRKSKLIHSGAVAQRVGEAITRATGAAIVKAATEAAEDSDEGDAPAGPAPQLVLVRLERDLCTISADSSGERLHRRGYRQAIAKAPIRETLAAGLLLAAGYDGSAPLVDPLCGSGTIAIEGALIARNLAPGLERPFACSAWGRVGAAVDAAERARARELARPVRASIHASDRDTGAIEAARANAERAHVANEMVIEARALSDAAWVAAPTGLLATNPPYGARVSGGRDLRDLYARLGQLARARLGGWRVAMVSADVALERATGLAFTERLRTGNGGIPVRFVVADVPAEGA